MTKDKIKFTTDGTYSVFCGKLEIARAYEGMDGEYEVRILQGMPRMETWEQIFIDCPEFAKNNDMKKNYVPKLFAQSKKKR